MKEILEAYKNMQLKPLYRQLLAEKLFIKEVTVHTLLSKNRSFKTEHLPVVKGFTKKFVQIEKKALGIVVKDCEVL